MKICPLMAFNADTDPLVFSNFEVPESVVNKLRSGKLQVIKLSNGGEPKIDIIRGTCKESDCAWWSEERKCCGVVK